MQRRTLVLAMAALCASSFAAAQRRIPRVGVMMMVPPGHGFTEALLQGLRDLGYVDGQNIQLDIRSAEADAARLPGIAADFAREGVDLIIAGGGTASAQAATKATTTIPIVFPVSADPVRSGVVSSLARPGGNATGQAFLDIEVIAKRMQLLKELRPKAGRIAVLVDPAVGVFREQLAATRKAAEAERLKLQIFEIRLPTDLDDAFAASAKLGVDAVMSSTSPFVGQHAKRAVQLAAEKRLLVIWDSRLYTDVGGLLSYGADVTHLYRTSARYVDRILKGAKPGDLPVEQASKFELIVNLKTAKAAGIAIPASVLVRADQIIA